MPNSKRLRFPCEHRLLLGHPFGLFLCPYINSFGCHFLWTFCSTERNVLSLATYGSDSRFFCHINAKTQNDMSNKTHTRRVSSARLRTLLDQLVDEIFANLKNSYYLCSAKFYERVSLPLSNRLIARTFFRAIFMPFHKQLRLSYPLWTFALRSDTFVEFGDLMGYDSPFCHKTPNSTNV